MREILVLITSSFPFQKGEEFLLQETTYYKAFKKVYIIPIAAKDFSLEKRISKDITVFRLETIASNKVIRKLLGCASTCFEAETRKEISFLIRTGRFNLSSLRQVLVDSYKVKSIKDEVFNIIDTISTKYKSDNIIIYSYWMGIHAKLATDIKNHFQGVSIVTRCHGGDLYEYRYDTNYIPFRNQIFNHEDCIFPISENGKQYLESNYNNIKAPIMVARLGTKRLFPRPVINNSNGINIVSCSYCIPLKRIELIIEALSGLDCQNITWTHIGDGIEFDNLQRLAAEVIPSTIRYRFLGYLSNDSVQELYSKGNYNLFINVSETEGIPVSIMEAMSYGLPVLATDVGGVSEMVADGVNGFLLPKSFDIELLRNRISFFLNANDYIYSAMSEKSYQTWKDKFNSEKNYSSFMKKLKDI